MQVERDKQAAIQELQAELNKARSEYVREVRRLRQMLVDRAQTLERTLSVAEKVGKENVLNAAAFAYLGGIVSGLTLALIFAPFL